MTVFSNLVRKLTDFYWHCQDHLSVVYKLGTARGWFMLVLESDLLAFDGFCLLQATFSADYEMKTDLIFYNLR